MQTEKPESQHALEGSPGCHPTPQVRGIHLPLRSGVAKTLVLLAVGIPALMMSLKVSKIALAAHFGDRLDARDLRRAIALDPGNAKYDHQLGLLYAYSINNGNPADAMSFLQRATQLNPLNATYWADLAEACDSNGDPACAAHALKKAISLSPMTPRFEWVAGNHFLQAGQTELAMTHFRRLLELDDTYARPVFHICLRAVGDPQTVFERVLPKNKTTDLELVFLDSVSKPSDTDFANQIWDGISSHGFTGDFSDVRPYLEFLLRTDEVPQAERVWQDLERSGVVKAASSSETGNLVYNGGFEQTPLPAGFDWRAPNTPYVETDFCDPSAYKGAGCLRVDYAAGHNLESTPVYEIVPVAPHQAYRLTAYARSDSITSDSGPRLRVVDPECPDCLSASTPTTVGTTPWHLLTLDFTTGAKTRVIQLSVWRPRSRTFPMEISGSFWLDDVVLKPLKSTPVEASVKR